MAMQQSFPGPSGVTDQTEARKDFAGLVIRDTAGNARPGIFPRHTNALVTARGDMTVDVASFEGCSVRGGGPLFLANDGTAQPSGTIVSPASNSQYYVVYTKQNESASPYSDANDLAVLAVQGGTAAPSPDLAALLAALPAGAVPIASILMPSGKTATNQSGVVIAQIFQYTTTTGGKIWVRVASDLTPMTGYAIDTLAYCIGDGIIYRYNGTGWKPWDSDWITYTPTLTNITLGNGTFDAQYKYVNGQVRVRYIFTFGSTSAMGSVPQVGLPTLMRVIAFPFFQLEGQGGVYDVSAAGAPSTSDFHRFNVAQTGAVGVTVLYNPSGAAANISASAPMVWATGDILHGTFTYDPQ